MRNRPPNLPALYVEGADDVSAIAALLKRHGLDTKMGQSNLWIGAIGSVDELLATMPDTIRAERGFPVGFVLDIDIELRSRWDAVCGQLSFRGDAAVSLVTELPEQCQPHGFISRLKDYPFDFGV